ncbi:MAG: sulfur oxidation c-type cytochrome SoxX [Betaproteobacteria bacterium RIFCSPLOWO2_02_FULL_62_17]|nr:MAG: sulfur oxidation c-type cytochrome SoxX [Betaproteobacteria bacterium RIFCSPLOWO2_02_FULL_62_17]
MKRILISLCMMAVTAFAAGAQAQSRSPVSDVEAMREMMRGFNPRGQAGLSRLVQDEAQQFCSDPGWRRNKARIAAIEKQQLAAVKYPADGKLMGNWQAGERVAQSGAGKQFSDNPSQPSGANCYACHQLSPQELSYGTIGPSLRNFGKTRGTSEAIQRYAYAKIYNARAYSVCSNMPRFGHSEILTEQQIKDVVALLLDPNSPVNK